jgi:hypothetical protein
MECLQIPSESLFDFIKRYLAARTAHGGQQPPEPDALFDACADLTRLLRDTPTTPLLATMWADEIAAAGRPTIDSVAELMDRYVRRLLRPTTQDNEATIERLRLDATAIAQRELGRDFRPGNVTRADALQMVRDMDANEPERRVGLLERSRLLEATSADSDQVHIAPDPVAEHRVARARVEALGGNAAEWRRFLAELRRQGMPEGFVGALRACSRHGVYGRSVPAQIRGVLEVSATRSHEPVIEQVSVASGLPLTLPLARTEHEPNSPEAGNGLHVQHRGHTE